MTDDSSGNDKPKKPSSPASFETGGGLEVLAESVDKRWIGRHIGAYKLHSILGKGGMGQVFRATRVDGAYQREVAIKISMISDLDETAAARFAREENILARMDHPNIATIYDAGVTEEGWPYFVMALVDGLHIDQYVADQQSSVGEIVSLIEQVVEAVAYAHARLVIHRDIKPSNILIEADGTAKLLDFGIAKLLADGAEEATQTQALTPGYASPEQLLKTPITIASDIFQLGLVLHQLVLGEPAFGERSYSGALTDALQHRPYQMSPDLWNRVPRDLGAIISTCLQSEPKKRYRDANQLLDDLRNFQNQRPVSARPVSFAYRLARIAARNKAVTLVSLASVITLLAGSFGYTLQLKSARDKAQTQRYAAEQARFEAEAVTEFLADTLASADPGIDGKDVKVRSVIDKAVVALDDELLDQPKAKARLHATIGNTYLGLGLYGQAEDQLRKALSLYDLLPELEPSLRLEVLGDIIWLKREAGDKEEALRLSKDVHEQWVEHYGPDHPEVLTALDDVAKNYVDLGQFADAGTLFEEVLQGRIAAVGQAHPSTARALAALGDFYWQSGDLENGHKYLEQAFESQRSLLGPSHPTTLVSMGNLTAIKRLLGDTPGAIATRREMLEIQLRSLGPEHPHTLITMGNLAITLDPLPEFIEEREQLIRDVVATNERTLGTTHARTLYTSHNLGTILREHGKLAESVQIYQTLIPNMIDILGEQDLWTLRAIRSYGSTLCHQRRFDESEAQFDRLEGLIPTDYPKSHRLWGQIAAVKAACEDIKAGRAEPYKQPG